MKQKILVVGGGQMGGSITLKLAEGGNYDLAIYDRNPETATFWRESAAGREGRLSVVDDLTTAGTEADFIILATPISAFGEITAEVAPHFKPGAIISDIGSAKVESAARIRNALQQSKRDDIHYMPAHPGTDVAGAGPDTAKADMFVRQPFFVVPPAAGSDAAVKDAFARQNTVWQELVGPDGTLTEIDEASHDAFFGTTSHLEHAIVFALLASGRNQDGEVNEEYQNAGTYLKNITRIGKGANVDMWTSVFVDNAAAVGASGNRFRNYLGELTRLIEEDKREDLVTLLKQAHEYRKMMKNDIKRETIRSEYEDACIPLPDYSGTAGAASLTSQFNERSYRHFARVTAVPTLLAAAITLNIQETDNDHVHGISIAEKINPSALDGTAPMLTDPDFVASMLLDPAVKPGLLQAMGRFKWQYDWTMMAIDARCSTFMKETIVAADKTRSAMGPALRGDTARQEYTIVT